MKNKKGVSLVEILIVCAIIGILSAALLASINSGNKDRQALKIAAREVAAAVRETQNYALTGKMINAGDKPCRFRMEDVGGNSYRIQYLNINPGGNCAGGWQDIYTKILSNGVSINIAGGGGKIDYDVPHGIRSSGGNLNDISLSRNGTTVHVCACQSGKVVEKFTGACNNAADCRN
jgi:prepilin-type N-terminal cleavage/methylation domain-containing protein